MEKTSNYTFTNNNYLVYIFSFVLATASISAEMCPCTFCNNGANKEISYKLLNEYEGIYREFELRIEIEENNDLRIEIEENNDLQMKGFFVRKWCKKIKNWFKKRVYKTFVKLSRFKKFKSGEHCAYEAARFKRKIDKKFYKTGDIEKFLDKLTYFAGNAKSSDLEKFKERIRFYWYNKKAKPKKPPYHDRYNQSLQYSDSPREGEKKSDLDGVPVRALIGGVEIFCGCLIEVLPFPGCQWLGVTLIAHGGSQIAEGYMREYEQQQ